MLVDTHCHLNLHQYNPDREEVVQRASACCVTRIIIPAIDMQTSHEAIALARQYEGIYAAVGFHPNDTADFSYEAIQQLEKLSHQPKVLSIGEIGLDYYWDKSPKAKQFEAFEAQLELAAKLELPVIIHNREASEDVLNILEHWTPTLPESLKGRAGVLHSFSGSMAIAERTLAIGFYLGFTGPITFKKAEETRAIARMTPLDKILVETDGPYLTPEPYRGKRNEPSYIPYIVEKLASVKEISIEAMGQATTENAKRLFQFT